jgi:MFS family permease
MKTPTQWLVLAVVLMGTFMAVLDVAIVNVAIPSIRSDLNASFGDVASTAMPRKKERCACSPVRPGRCARHFGTPTAAAADSGDRCRNA